MTILAQGSGVRYDKVAETVEISQKSYRGGEYGCVANFAQEVVKGQLPLSVEGLRGQGVEQFGRSEALCSGLHHHLSFLDHVHEFNPDQGVLGCVERFEPQHRPCHPLHPAMILFHNIRVVPQ